MWLPGLFPFGVVRLGISLPPQRGMNRAFVFHQRERLTAVLPGSPD